MKEQDEVPSDMLLLHPTNPPDHRAIVATKSLQIRGIGAPRLTAVEHRGSDTGAVDVAADLW